MRHSNTSALGSCRKGTRRKVWAHRTWRSFPVPGATPGEGRLLNPPGTQSALLRSLLGRRYDCSRPHVITLPLQLLREESRYAC